MYGRYFSTIALSCLLCQVPTLGADYASRQSDGPASGEYLLFGKSMFDYSSGANAYMNGGVPVSHSVNITFDESGAVTIDGLLGVRNTYNPIVGNYNTTSGSFEFNTPLEELSSFSRYVSLDSSEDAETLLCALNPYGLGYVDLQPKLTFTFSEDFHTVYPSSGFGSGLAYLVSPGLYQIGSYDVAIYDALLLKKQEGLSFDYDFRKADISNSYPGMPVASSFRIFNTGVERSEYVIGSSSRQFSISNPAGVLNPGEYVDIQVLFLADEQGEYSSRITITNEDKDAEFEIHSTCNPLPDYSRIVTEGDFLFATDARYPWTISEKFGKEPVAVCGNSGHEMSESPLYAEVEIPEKHYGKLSWEGYCDPYHPMRDAFGVVVDGAECYVSPTGGGNTSASLDIAPGKHRIEFLYVKGPKVEGSFAAGDDYAWIKGLSLKELPLEQYAFSVDNERVGFTPKTIVKKGARDTAEVLFKNDGWDDLMILGADSDNEAFSAEIPTNPISTFATSPVKLIFHTFTSGKHSGTVTIHTNVGDVDIRCSGEAVAVPDYSPIVKNGDFDFDTSISYPFTVDGNTAYNSTSKKTDRKATTSMLQANFEVPQGYYGELSWNARVSTSGSDGEDATDTASIFIDGEDTVLDYNGEAVATQYDFAPASVNFYPGSHFVCFAYYQVGDGRYQGDDCIEVSDLSLVLKKMKDNEVSFWGSDEVAFDDVWISKVYQREVKLTNLGSRNLQIQKVKCEGGFEVEMDPERMYNTFEEIPVTVTFIPRTAGEHNGDILLETSAGEIRIKCHATVVDDPSTLLIEDFEDDWRFWDLIDGDGDGMTWANVMVPQNAYHGEHALQSFSIHSDFTDSAIDDIAFSPEVTIPAGGAELNFHLACYFPAAADAIQILAGNGTDITKYSPVADFDLKDVAPYYNPYECSLKEYAGKTVRIAFRHALDKGVMSFVAIDDITVTTDDFNGVKNMESEMSQPVMVEYYNLQGIKVKNPEKGVYVRRTVYADGREKVSKINLINSIE